MPAHSDIDQGLPMWQSEKPIRQIWILRPIRLECNINALQGICQNHDKAFAIRHHNIKCKSKSATMRLADGCNDKACKEELNRQERFTACNMCHELPHYWKQRWGSRDSCEAAHLAWIPRTWSAECSCRWTSQNRHCHNSISFDLVDQQLHAIHACHRE